MAEKELKNENKKKWFEFCENLKDTIEEYNLGTLLRIRANGVYSEENTIVVPKVQIIIFSNLDNFLDVHWMIVYFMFCIL